MVRVLSDLAAGIPALEFWNIGMALASYVLFAGVVSELGILVRELDRRVDERTAAYEREMVERRRLDQEIAQAADRERRRLCRTRSARRRTRLRYEARDEQKCACLYPAGTGR